MGRAIPLQFGDRLRELRKSAGLTQEELAERAGLSVKAVSALERGRRQRPYPHTVRALAEALGLSDEERATLAGLTPERRPAASVDRGVRPSFPSAPTPLIGRERELADVVALLHDGRARLVTLTGPGGVGKTRLALEIGASLLDHVEGRVAFVPLAPLGDPGLVLATIAQAVGLPEAGDVPVRDTLLALFAEHPWLLVLDNVEHILDVAADVAMLLEASTGLMIVVTGRAPLKIRAEHEYPLRPLGLPDLSGVPDLAEVARASSVQLFLNRAQAAVPDFELTQANCTAVAAICRRLDGLPLAIELVAARVRFLSPTELLARLDHLLPLLVGGSRDLPERQQTMQAAINWSYELLQEQEQAFFRRLSVFAGGWTLDAAEQVVAWDEIAFGDVIDLLAGLVEQSLVVVESGPDGATRYRMLEPIRQFAQQSAEDAGEATLLNERHLDWALSLAQLAESRMLGPEQREWLDRLEADHDNLRAALAWSGGTTGGGERQLRLATALWRFWETRGHLTEGRRWLAQALASGEAMPTDLRSEGLNAAGNLARDQGDYAQAMVLHGASLALRRDLGDTYGLAKTLNNLGNLMLDQGQYQRATELYAEALEYFRDLDKEWDVANGLNNLGVAHGYCGDYPEATRLLEEALALREKLGETASRARSLDALGVVMRKQGNLERARQLHEESLELRTKLGEPRGIAIALNNLGVVARYQGNFEEAAALIEESLRIRQEVGDRFGVASSLRGLAEVALGQGEIDRARTYYQESLTTQQQTGSNDGLADSLYGLAIIAASAHDPMRAAQFLAASDAVRQHSNQTVSPVDQPEYDRLLSSIKANLTPEHYEAAVAVGSAMDLNAVTAETEEELA